MCLHLPTTPSEHVPITTTYGFFIGRPVKSRVIRSPRLHNSEIMAKSNTPPTPMMNGVSMVCGEHASASVSAKGRVRKAARNCQKVANDCPHGSQHRVGWRWCEEELKLIGSPHTALSISSHQWNTNERAVAREMSFSRPSFHPSSCI